MRQCRLTSIAPISSLTPRTPRTSRSRGRRTLLLRRKLPTAVTLRCQAVEAENGKRAANAAYGAASVHAPRLQSDFTSSEIDVISAHEANISEMEQAQKQLVKSEGRAWCKGADLGAGTVEAPHVVMKVVLAQLRLPT